MPQRGRPRRYAQYEDFYRKLPKGMAKRPRYLNGIGIFRGAKSDTAWIKVHLPSGGVYRGKRYKVGTAIELKVGRLTSWDWAQLERKRDELQGLADRGEPLEPPFAPMFKEWAEEWLSRAKPRLRSFPIASIHVRQRFIPRFGELRLNEITTDDINRWIADRLQIAAPATTKRELSTLSAILGSAVRAHVLSSNPCAGADYIRGVVGRQRFLDGTELVKLLSAAESVSKWLPNFILWCVHSGMRRGEVQRLTWDSIHMLPDGRCVVEVRTSKTDTPRFITCTRTMVHVIEQQRLLCATDKSRLFHVSAITLRRHWEKARTLAGLKDVTIHDLRRTHGTHSAAAGVDLRTLADRLGHTDLTMLQRHYAAVVGTAATEAAELFQRAFDALTHRS